MDFDPSEFADYKASATQFDPKEFDAAKAAGSSKTKEAAKGPDQGVANATARGVANGVSANFYDELRGLVEASGASPKDPASIYNLVHGAINYWSGDKEAQQRYDATASRERQLTRDAEIQHPMASTVGQVGGALALPVGAGASGATLGARMARSSAAGAVYGGLSGAGDGVGAADTASRATMGAGLGAAVGGLAPPVVEGAIQGVKSASGPIINAIRGAVNPEAEASRRVATAVMRDAKADPNAEARLTPSEFSSNVQAGGPATIMDMGGGLTRRLADSAAITSPEAGTALNSAINNRFEGQSSRVTGWLNDTFHYPNAFAQQEAIDTVAKTVNKGAYDRVMTQHPVIDVPTDITDRPAVAQAMRDAVSLAKNYGEKLQSPTETKTILSGDGYHIADDVSTPAKTSLRYWDYVKKAMDARIEGMKRGGGIDSLNGKEAADFRGLVDARKSLVEHLDAEAPGYKDARAGAARFFGAENALEAGQNFVGAKLGNDEAQAALSKMTPTERNLFRDGFVSRYIETINETGDRRSVLNKIADSPAARQRLEMVLGKDRSNEMEGMLRVEGVMDLARKAVQGNSWTARRLYDMGLAGGLGLGATGGYNMDPKEMAAGAVISALASGGKKIDSRVAQKVGEMLVSQDPQMMLRGLKLLSRNNGMMDSLRAVDRRIAAAGSEQVPSGGAVQALAPGHAQDDQPSVPGPSAQ